MKSVRKKLAGQRQSKSAIHWFFWHIPSEVPSRPRTLEMFQEVAGSIHATGQRGNFNGIFSWLLKQQAYRPEIVQGVFDMRCSACSIHQQPRISRPSTIKDPLDFNDRISIDGLTYTAKDGHKYHIYHIIDYATSYHVACPAPKRSSARAIQFIGQRWIAWAGAPVELVVDAATEFNSQEMEEFCNRFNICKSTICPRLTGKTAELSMVKGGCEENTICATQLMQIELSMLPLKTKVEPRKYPLRKGETSTNHQFWGFQPLLLKLSQVDH